MSRRVTTARTRRRPPQRAQVKTSRANVRPEEAGPVQAGWLRGRARGAAAARPGAVVAEAGAAGRTKASRGRRGPCGRGRWGRSRRGSAPGACGRRDEGGEAPEEGGRRQDEDGRGGAAHGVLHQAVVAASQARGGQRPAGAVARQPLEALPVVGVDPGVGVQREAVDDGDAAVRGARWLRRLAQGQALLERGQAQGVEAVLRVDVGVEDAVLVEEPPGAPHQPPREGGHLVGRGRGEGLRR